VDRHGGHCSGRVGRDEIQGKRRERVSVKRTCSTFTVAHVLKIGEQRSDAVPGPVPVPRRDPAELNWRGTGEAMTLYRTA